MHFFSFNSVFLKTLKIFICLILAALGLCCCTRAFSSCSERHTSLVAMRGASRCSGPSLWRSAGSRARGLQYLQRAGSAVVMQELSCCSIWHLPGPGIEPESLAPPALAERFPYHWVTREARSSVWTLSYFWVKNAGEEQGGCFSFQLVVRHVAGGRPARAQIAGSHAPAGASHVVVPIWETERYWCRAAGSWWDALGLLSLWVLHLDTV